MTAISTGDLFYWRTPSGSEVDFIWRPGRRSVGVELKASPRWQREDAGVLQQLIDEKVLTSGYLVHGGTEVLKSRQVTVLPVLEFCARVARGDLFA